MTNFNLIKEATATYKAINQDLRSLSNTDLICNLLGNTSNVKTLKTATNILQNFDNNLAKIATAKPMELLKTTGIGEIYASRISSAFELARRIETRESLTKIGGAADVFDALRGSIGHLEYEEFWVLLLNRNNKIIKKVKISSGGVSGVFIDVKIVLHHAINNLSSGIILAHNHPSGNLKPSQADKNMTIKIKKACDHCDITLMDHLIITADGYYSFADEGIL